jgi:RND superfamily putative drug exporter
VVGIWLAVLIGVVGFTAAFGGVLNNNFDIPGTNSTATNKFLSDHFPAFSGATSRVVVHSDEGVDQGDLAEGIGELQKLRGVSDVAPAIFNDERTTAIINVQYDVQVTEFKGSEGLDDLKDATKSIKDEGYQVEYGGQIPENVQKQSGAEAIGMIAALIILVVAFGSLLAAGAPIVVAVVGLVTGVSAVTLVAAVTDVSTFVPMLATMVGLGVGIDYALFILTRFRQELRGGASVPDAIATANATAGQSVVFAGVTVLLALSGLALSGLPTFTTMGLGTGIVVITTMLTAITLLPAVLRLFGERMLPKKVRAELPAVRAGEKVLPSASPRWVTNLATRVGARPWPWAVGVLIVLALLAAPTFSMRLWPSDVGAQPSSTTIRKAYDLVADEFGPGANGTLMVVVDLRKTSESELPAIAEELRGVDGVDSVSPPQYSPRREAAIITVTPDFGPSDKRTPELVSDVRDAAPQAVGVTGLTAVYSDLSEVLARNLWKVIAVVVVTALVLLTIMFRSVVLPLKAAAMNLLSVGAAYGVIVAVFQWGWGASLLGLPHAVPVSSFMPMLMFTLLFGLSMDYEVFLLSRVRERWRQTGDAKSSVVEGLSSTARVITSAALIMVAVFIGFALDPDIIIKTMGIGMATAVFVDATLIRLILVPALMSLLGARNWWLPGWLDRLLPHLDHESAVASPLPREPEAPREPVGASA